MTDMPSATNVNEFSFFTKEECDDIKDYCIGIEEILIEEGHD